MMNTKKKELQKIIGSWILQLRIEAGLSQSQLSSLCGIPISVISKIENGHANITIEVIGKLSEALNFYIFFIPKDSNDPMAKAMRERLTRRNDNG